ESGAAHHGFMALYTYLEKVFFADAVVHVGTHGAMEFMPGKQVGLSENCWPDRLIGELPNLYIYSVNNPSEGTIAKRRSYAELVSYLTPPIENAGLYKELASIKELLTPYRRPEGETERRRMLDAIEEKAKQLNLLLSLEGRRFCNHTGNIRIPSMQRIPANSAVCPSLGVEVPAQCASVIHLAREKARQEGAQNQNAAEHRDRQQGFR